MHVSAGQERVREGIGGSGGAEVTAAVTLLEVAEPVQRAGIGGAAGQGLLVEPPGLGVVALVAVGLIPLEELFLFHLASRATVPATLPVYCTPSAKLRRLN
jgi:hypothetical protein